MGGADEFNFTQKVLDTILEDESDMKITVITGAGYSHRKELEMSLSESKNDYVVKQNINDMFEEYMDCDVAVGAGGLTSYELIATATPAILIATYEHQIERCKYFQDYQGWAKYLGYRSYDPKALGHLIKNPPAPADTNIFDTRKIIDAVNELL
jgi:spore coat polysaccharide biosynthesis predicted glycosyltransferase SpsG